MKKRVFYIMMTIALSALVFTACNGANKGDWEKFEEAYKKLSTASSYKADNNFEVDFLRKDEVFSEYRAKMDVGVDNIMVPGPNPEVFTGEDGETADTTEAESSSTNEEGSTAEKPEDMINEFSADIYLDYYSEYRTKAELLEDTTNNSLEMPTDEFTEEASTNLEDSTAETTEVETTEEETTLEETTLEESTKKAAETTTREVQNLEKSSTDLVIDESKTQNYTMHYIESMAYLKTSEYIDSEEAQLIDTKQQFEIEYTNAFMATGMSILTIEKDLVKSSKIEEKDGNTIFTFVLDKKQDNRFASEQLYNAGVQMGVQMGGSSVDFDDAIFVATVDKNGDIIKVEFSQEGYIFSPESKEDHRKFKLNAVSDISLQSEYKIDIPEDLDEYEVLETEEETGSEETEQLNPDDPDYEEKLNKLIQDTIKGNENTGEETSEADTKDETSESN